jgi:hypothetical protein
MSGGVISPTNLSLYSTPVTTPRTTPRSRWNNPFLLEEDFTMMTQSSNNPENNSVILMEEGEFLFSQQQFKKLLWDSPPDVGFLLFTLYFSFQTDILHPHTT